MRKLSNQFLILIQARVYSTRLPGKIFFNFFNKTVIERIINISRKCVKKKNIFILSGTKNLNYPLDYIAKKNKIKIFYGSESNVHNRFKSFLNSQKIKPQFVCRLTSDNYLIQPSIIKKMIFDAKKSNFDYSFVKPLSHFAGEIIKTSLFFKKEKLSNLAKEHVTWDFRKNSYLKIKAYPSNFCNLNHNKFLVLDTIKDFIKFKAIEKKFPGLKKLDCIKEVKKAIKFIS